MRTEKRGSISRQALQGREKQGSFVEMQEGGQGQGPENSAKDSGLPWKVKGGFEETVFSIRPRRVPP